MAQGKSTRSKALLATIAVITLVLVGTFMFQLGQRGSSNSANSTNNAGGGTAGTATKAATKSAAMKKVGILQFVSHPALNQIHKGVVDELKKEGFTPGKNVEILDQNGQGDESKLATMSQQLEGKKPDVLVGIATPAAQALANATSTTPIVMAAVTDPVSAGLVKNLNHPGGNITGVSDKAPADKQIELGSKLIPSAKTVGMIYSSSEDNSKFQVDEAEQQAKSQGLNVKRFAVPSSNEIAQTIDVMRSQVDFIYIPLDNTIANAMPTVTQEANKTRTPVITSVDTMVEQGGLATIGINQYQLGVQSGKMAAKILRGQGNPATMPVYTFKDGDTILNMKQADFLGVKVPADIKAHATIVGGKQ